LIPLYGASPIIEQAADLGGGRALSGPLRQPQFDQTTEALTFARSQIA